MYVKKDYVQCGVGKGVFITFQCWVIIDFGVVSSSKTGWVLLRIVT